MYRFLKGEMVKRNISRKDLAEAIGKSQTTINCKLRGEYSFTYDEAITIYKRFFVDLDIFQLFEKEQEYQQTS